MAGSTVGTKEEETLEISIGRRLESSMWHVQLITIRVGCGVTRSLLCSNISQ